MLSPLMILSPDHGKIYRREPILPEPEAGADALVVEPRRPAIRLAIRLTDWILFALSGSPLA